MSRVNAFSVFRGLREIFKIVIQLKKQFSLGKIWTCFASGASIN